MNESSPLPPDVLEMLRQYDTPTICNVIELFDVRPRTSGYMDQRIKAHFPEMPPMVGYASTATYRSSAPPQGADVYDAMQKQLSVLRECSGPHVIVFQDLDDPSTAATFGEVMCTSYQTFGAVGLITSGTGRDLDQVRDGFRECSGPHVIVFQDLDDPSTAANRISRLQQRHQLLPRLLPHPGRGRPGARRWAHRARR